MRTALRMVMAFSGPIERACRPSNSAVRESPSCADASARSMRESAPDLVQRTAPARRPELLNGREEFAGGDRSAFFGGDREDAAGAVGLQLVLHLHGFHYDDALTGDHLVAGGGEDADYFAGHGAEDGLHGARAGSRGFAGPAARVAGFDGETVAFDGDDEAGGRFFHTDVVAAAIEEDGVDAGAGHLHVGFARRGAAELEAAGWGGREDLDGVGAAVDGEREFHRRSPSLPAVCQGLAVGAAAVLPVAPAAGLRAVVWSAAARAATMARSGGGSGGVWRWKNSSMKPVCRWAARNSGSSRIWRKKPRLVRIPPTSCSRRARSMRVMACSRVSAQTASLASRGSYSMGTVRSEEHTSELQSPMYLV